MWGSVITCLNSRLTMEGNMAKCSHGGVYSNSIFLVTICEIVERVGEVGQDYKTIHNMEWQWACVCWPLVSF